MANPVPSEYHSLIRYNRQWQAIICFQCKGHAAVGRKNLIQHLRETHHLTVKDYKPLIQALDASGVPILQSLDEFPRPINDSVPVEELSILKGLKCNHCGFLSTSMQVMRAHTYNEKQKVQEVSQDTVPYLHPGTQSVALQTWSSYGWKGGYWTVIDPNSSFEMTTSQNELEVDKTPLTWMERMIQ